ncbi:uncharacterized protein LOC102564320 [Alligator mississippiensis]|uniref:uncharacterized protein LOC102564320 n=1 Tax=Alligator mississippiensis TaxID=8496 RepID=UPI002878054D|nr:uncharacterized protein LOC102564320 [Alligator mississippiensis]
MGGTLRALILGLALLGALMVPAWSLTCKQCHGEFGCDVESEVMCAPGEDACRTAVRTAAVSFMQFQAVTKGCARGGARPEEALELRGHLFALATRTQHCAHNHCNDDVLLAAPPAAPNALHCHSCSVHEPGCPPTARTLLGCTGAQDRCFDLALRGVLGSFSDMRLKGCALLPGCDHGALGFDTGSGALRAQCCNTHFCNHQDSDLHLEAEAPNGLHCLSCLDQDGSGCPTDTDAGATVQCTGAHTVCLEGVGRTRRGTPSGTLVTFKGCATPAMCQSSLLALVQELDDTQVLCCNGSLCNRHLPRGVLVAASTAPQPTGVPNCMPCTSTPTLPPIPKPDCIQEDNDHTGPRPGTATTMGGHGATLPPSTERSWDRMLVPGGFYSDDSTARTADEQGHPAWEAAGNYVTAAPQGTGSSRDQVLHAGGFYSNNNTVTSTGGQNQPGREVSDNHDTASSQSADSSWDRVLNDSGVYSNGNTMTATSRQGWEASGNHVTASSRGSDSSRDQVLDSGGFYSSGNTETDTGRHGQPGWEVSGNHITASSQGVDSSWDQVLNAGGVYSNGNTVTATFGRGPPGWEVSGNHITASPQGTDNSRDRVLDTGGFYSSGNTVTATGGHDQPSWEASGKHVTVSSQDTDGSQDRVLNAGGFYSDGNTMMATGSRNQPGQEVLGSYITASSQGMDNSRDQVLDAGRVYSDGKTVTATGRHDQPGWEVSGNHITASPQGSDDSRDRVLDAGGFYSSGNTVTVTVGHGQPGREASGSVAPAMVAEQECVDDAEGTTSVSRTAGVSAPVGSKVMASPSPHPVQPQDPLAAILPVPYLFPRQMEGGASEAEGRAMVTPGTRRPCRRRPPGKGHMVAREAGGARDSASSSTHMFPINIHNITAATSFPGQSRPGLPERGRNETWAKEPGLGKPNPPLPSGGPGPTPGLCLLGLTALLGALLC